jgi:8-oxo-dGTP pyrophosphatase MutT (NUDIX family)
MAVERIGQILQSRAPLQLDGRSFKHAAVLVPVQQRGGEEHLVFTRRALHLSHHQGHIAFPGGKIDPEDKDALEAALRESREEIGIRPSDVSILGQLDQVTAGFDFLITPFVGAIPHPYDFIVNKEETEEVFTAPISRLLDQGCFEVQQRPPSSGRDDPIYHFYYDGRDIWGATARIVKQFLELAYDFKT